jgi:hypothetical protein
MKSVEDEYLLVVPPQCDMTLQSVVVKYYGEDDDDWRFFDDLETVWAAEATDSGRKSVVLFEENAGYSNELAVNDIGQRVVIGWTGLWASGNTGGDAVDGVLDEIGDDEILWFDGVKSRGTYDSEALIPWRGTPC